MNNIAPLLTRENLLFYYKESAKELEREIKKLKDLEWLCDITNSLSPNFWYILARIRNA